MWTVPTRALGGSGWCLCLWEPGPWQAQPVQAQLLKIRAKPLVGSVGACCRGNPSQRPPSWLGCPVWLQVSVPVPWCRPLCQPALCPVFLGVGSRCGVWVAQAGGRTLGALTEHNGLSVRPRLDWLVWRLCGSRVCDCVVASVGLFPWVYIKACNLTVRVPVDSCALSL